MKEPGLPEGLFFSCPPSKNLTDLTELTLSDFNDKSEEVGEERANVFSFGGLQTESTELFELLELFRTLALPIVEFCIAVISPSTQLMDISAASFRPVLRIDSVTVVLLVVVLLSLAVVDISLMTALSQGVS